MPDATDLFDAFLSYDYLVLGIFSLRARQFSVGPFQNLGGAIPPDDLAGRDIWSSQAVTPIANGKARYFFSQGPGMPIPQEFSDFLWQVVLGAFAKDRIMIEGQQRIIDLDPGRRIMPAAGDKGTVLFTRLVERLIRTENGNEAAG